MGCYQGSYLKLGTHNRPVRSDSDAGRISTNRRITNASRPFPSPTSEAYRRIALAQAPPPLTISVNWQNRQLSLGATPT
jgi:hypothetical protein